MAIPTNFHSVDTAAAIKQKKSETKTEKLYLFTWEK